ncbi:MAG: recombinase family protein [Acidimicrobiia bacterium]
MARKTPTPKPSAPANVEIIDLGGAPTRVGYARVSTAGQTLDQQLDALRKADVGRVFVDVASGAKASRPGLDAMRSHLRAGDTVVVSKLDRLGRSTVDLLTTLNDWCAVRVDFVAVEQGIDTSTAAGRMICAMLAAVAEFERELIRERTSSALAARKARGITGGRPSVVDADKLARAARLMEAGATLTDAAAAVGVGRSTLARHRAAAVSA